MLAREDYVRPSESFWGATAEAVKAVAEHRGREH